MIDHGELINAKGSSHGTEVDARELPVSRRALEEQRVLEKLGDEIRLCGVEMALAASRIPHKSGGVAAALAFLAGATGTTSGAQALAASTA